MKKLNSGIISIQKGFRQAKKEIKKILVSNSVLTEQGKKIPKKIAKKFKKSKNLFPAFFLGKIG